MIKPNEHEARLLSGVAVHDFKSAKDAARIIINSGVENVLITAGAKGAYLFTHSEDLEIPAPKLKTAGVKDETGCGDQAMAALCAALQAGKDLKQATTIAVRAGTLQFCHSGIHPLSKADLEIS